MVQDIDPRDTESPVSGQELDTYLATMFYMVDTYRTGLVSARSLLEHLTNLVDLPKLDKWKLEELSRMLDPNKDNRYVDMELWSEVGQAWVEMMMDPDNHSDKIPMTGGEDADDKLLEFDDISLVDISYGSIEGVGGVPGCSSREVELENEVSELRYQLARLTEEKKQLERHLAASEDLGISLTTELEGSHRQVASLSTSINKGDMLYEEVKQAREVKDKCGDLTVQVEQLTRELNFKDDKLGDVEVAMVSLRGELEEGKERVVILLKELDEEKEKRIVLEENIDMKNEQIKREISAREEVEEKLESTQLDLRRLGLELSVKDEAIRNFTDNSSKTESVGSSMGSGADISMINDVSVDDRVIEENMKSLSSPAPVFTPGKLPLQSPIRRGPSASSTPSKGRLGSIADELKELDINGFPSPFCEKEASDVKKEVLKFVDKLGETVRKILLEQVEPGESKQVMAALNKEIFSVKKVIEDMVDELPSKEEITKMKECTIELEEKLANAEAMIDNLKNLNNIDNTEELKEPIIDTREEDVEVFSNQIEVVTSLLKSANSALLGVNQESSETVPDSSLETETDFSSWQLDLEGIQLLEYNTQLSKKLIHYTKMGKKNIMTEISTGILSPFPTEISKSPVPGGKLWKSLHKRLEELKKESEVSRDLLTMAEDSMREQSINQSTSILYPKTVSCQTDVATYLSRASQTILPSTTTTTVSVCQHSQTEENITTSTCQGENCFCSSSQARSRSTRWWNMFRVAGSMVFYLLLFTFFGGLELDSSLYYPVTWYPLRWAVGDWLPPPRITMSYQTVSSGVW